MSGEWLEPWQHAVAALPFEWTKFEFMRLALLAVLIIAPLLGALGTVVVANRLAFFSEAVGHAAFTGIALGVILGLGNGTVEAFINPVVATIFNRDKTKWLNILHAGWPGGLAQRFSAEGWAVTTVDGRDHDKLTRALSAHHPGRPTTVVATVEPKE